MPPVVAATPADRENSNLLPLQIVSVPGAALLVVCLIAGVIFTAILQNGLPILIGAIVGLYLFFAIKVAKQWEKCAVLRLGKYRGLRGPGLFHIVPIIDSISRYVDQRVRVTDVRAETA